MWSNMCGFLRAGGFNAVRHASVHAHFGFGGRNRRGGMFVEVFSFLSANGSRSVALPHATPAPFRK